MANMNPNDPLVTLHEAASRMGVNHRRARTILTRNLIRPVRTATGLCYRLGDVLDVKRMYS